MNYSQEKWLNHFSQVEDLATYVAVGVDGQDIGMVRCVGGVGGGGGRGRSGGDGDGGGGGGGGCGGVVFLISFFILK